MIIFSVFEQKKQFFISAIVLIAMAALTVTSMREMAGSDPFWHLQMGKDWWENGYSPWVDHYSFTYYGQGINNPPIIFQSILYMAVNQFGEYGGFFLVRIAAFLSVVFVLIIWLKRIDAPIFAYLVTIPLTTYLLQLRAIVRPELISYSFIIIAIILYENARRNLSLRTVWPILILLFVWSNYHSSIIGYAIFVGLFVDTGIRNLQKRSGKTSWFEWLGWGLIVIGVGFINPQVNHAIIETLTFPAEWKVFIQEYQPPSQIYSNLPSLYLLIAISGLTIIALAVQKKYGYLVTALIFVYSAATMARMVTPAGLVILCLFALVMKKFVSGKDGESLTYKSVASISLIIAMLVTFEVVQFSRGYIAENQQQTYKMPQEVVDYILEKKHIKRIFNSYQVGGFLISRLETKSQIYIDGRTQILYPIEHFKKFQEAYFSGISFNSEVERYDIEAAVIEAHSISAREMMKAEFELDFVDTNYALFTKQQGQFKNTGIVWGRPYCWNKEISRGVMAEWEVAQSVLNRNSAIVPLLSVAVRFAQSANQSNLLNPESHGNIELDDIKRFIGYRAIEAKQYSWGVKWFNSIGSKTPKDHLATSFALIQLDQLVKAEKSVYESTSLPLIVTENQDFSIQYALLKEINSKTTLVYFNQSDIDRLATELDTPPNKSRLKLSSIQNFCDNNSL